MRNDVIADGHTRVAWVPTIADVTQPTVAELDAGVDLQWIVTADGLVGFEPTTAEVDNTALASTFDTRRAGRASFSGTLLRLKRQRGTDTVYETLTRYATGYVVIRRSVPEGDAWAAGQEVSVYPVECGETRHLPPEANSVERYEVPLMIVNPPALRAEVVAGA